VVQWLRVETQEVTGSNPMGRKDATNRTWPGGPPSKKFPFFGFFFVFIFAECPKNSTRQRSLCWLNFVVWSLLSVALGKDFAEYIWAFAECHKHLSKHGYPIVIVSISIF